MKRNVPVLVLVTAFLLLLFLTAALLVGCGGPGEEKNGGSGGRDDRAQADYDDGFSRGRADGYERGRDDGIEGRYDPQAPEMKGANEDYLLGYAEGWSVGYEEGHADGEKEAASGENELAEVEAAMIAFVKRNAAPGLEFRIEHIVIQGDEAVGRAVCTSERLESPYVVMKRGASGWLGVDFGTGIEPPAWYPY